MKQLSSIALLGGILITAGISSASQILTTAVVTTFGTWSTNWDNCPEGTFVTGMDLATVEIPTARNTVDKTGLLSVVFQCSYPLNSTQPIKFLFTEVGNVNNSILNSPIPGYTTKDKGDIKAQKTIEYEYPLRSNCEGVVLGIQLMNKEKQIALDNTGATNLRIFCSEMLTDEVSYVEGYGIYDGDWMDPTVCGERQAVCGLQTMAQGLNNAIDESGINALRVKCCDLPNPAEQCQPEEYWEVIQACDNTNSSSIYRCTFKRKVGVKAMFTGEGVDVRERDFYNNIGYSVSAADYQIFHALRNNFAETIPQSNLYEDWSWAATGLEIWEHEDTVELAFQDVPHSMKVTIFQLVGRCGYFSVRTPVFKQTTITVRN